jgi:acyl-CoA synthetase (AMP-forming)/AMP-acid ligase II
VKRSLKELLLDVWEADRTLRFYDLNGLSHTYSFAEFGRLVHSYEHRFLELGAASGVVIAAMGPTSPNLAAVCAAVWGVEATLTVLSTPTRLANLEQYLQETLEKLSKSTAQILIGDEDVVSVFRELAGIPVLSYQELLDGKSPVRMKPTDLECSLIQFSSGTTRTPTPIMLHQDALIHNSQAVLEKFPGGAAQHSCVSWLPLYHDMGLIGCFLMPLLAPADLTLMGPEVFAVRPLTWLEAISQQRATTSSAPNFALAHCVRRVSEEEVDKLDLTSWKIAMVGAEPVRPRTLEAFAEKFAPSGFSPEAFSPVYGLAEATLAVTFSPLGEGLKTYSFDIQEIASTGRVVPGERRSPSLGTPLSEVEVEIRAEDGGVLSEGHLGEVWIKSPSLMLGLLGEKTTHLKDGWLQSGDAGFLKDGDLYLYGRRRDILLLDGRNHDPALVEEAIESLSEIRRCCAFTQETEGDKDLLVVLCEVEPSYQGSSIALEERIGNRCRRRTNLYPDHVGLLKPGDLPVTSSGKLRRQASVECFTQGRFELLGAEA